MEGDRAGGAVPTGPGDRGHRWQCARAPARSLACLPATHCSRLSRVPARLPPSCLPAWLRCGAVANHVLSLAWPCRLRCSRCGPTARCSCTFVTLWPASCLQAWSCLWRPRSSARSASTSTSAAPVRSGWGAGRGHAPSFTDLRVRSAGAAAALKVPLLLLLLLPAHQ